MIRRAQRRGALGAKIGGVEKHNCVVRGVRQRYTPIPRIKPGLDPWLMGQAAAVPVAIERERAMTGALFTTAQNRRSAAGVCKEISVESPGSVRGLDIEMPALITARARAHHGGLHHTHAMGARAIEQQSIEAPTIDQEPARRAKIAVHRDIGFPLDQRRPARPEAGRGDGARYAEQLKLRPDAGAQRFADMRPWKHRPLDHANIMAELR